jgi:SAM-dependent methyltransferase
MLPHTAYQHFICPKTQRPLGFSGVSPDDPRLVSGTLSWGAEPLYSIQAGIADSIADCTPDSQTIRSFRQKWKEHRYYRNHTHGFYTEWYLQRYGFLTVENLRRFLSAQRTILDAGTGAGRDAVNFAEHSDALVYAVDTAKEALEWARRDVDHARVVFVRADVAGLPFPDDFFDFINCDQVIHHTPEPRTTFEHLKRKLKPGGTIAATSTGRRQRSASLWMTL